MKNKYKQITTPKNMPEIKRQTAIKCTIKQILEGTYVQRQGWQPNYIEISGKQISRVNILAALVNKQDNTLIIDDGTGKIPLRLFSEHKKADNLSIGDILLIIGRPREYNNERYITPEILRKIKNKKWIDHRQKELQIKETTPTKKTKPEKNEEKIEELPPQYEETANNTSKILQLIRNLDKGDGADTEQIIKESKIKNAEEHIQSLINEGEIYEIRPGKLKIL